VEDLTSKHKAVSSNLSSTKNLLMNTFVFSFHLCLQTLLLQEHISIQMLKLHEKE
jgi:hypothetical protein